LLELQEVLILTLTMEMPVAPMEAEEAVAEGLATLET